MEMRLASFWLLAAGIMVSIDATSPAMSQQPSAFADKLANGRDRAAYEELRSRLATLAADA